MNMKPRSRFARATMVALAGTAVSGILAVTMVHAESGRDEASMVRALAGVKLTMADAIRAAETAGQGIVTGAEVEKTGDRVYFDVTTQNGTVETDHRIDATTGAVVASTPDTGKPESDRDGSTDEAEELAAIRSAKVKLLQAVTPAEIRGDRVLSAEYGQEDDRLAIELKLADASGRVREVVIDAVTGKVIAADHDSADGEDGEHEG